MFWTCSLAHVSVCACVCWSVYQSVQKVYCDKTADGIQMLFGMVSWVGRGMGFLDGVVIVEGKWAFSGVHWASHCNQWGLCCIVA